MSRIDEIKPHCFHASKTDLTNGYGAIRNWYCPVCGGHDYQGREWTKEEWNNYINEPSNTETNGTE